MPEKRSNLGLAGGAVAMAMIDKLVELKVINRADALDVLATAQKRLVALRTTEAAQAARIIGDVYAKLLKDH